MAVDFCTLIMAIAYSSSAKNPFSQFSTQAQMHLRTLVFQRIHLRSLVPKRIHLRTLVPKLKCICTVAERK
jgi:hypothetical protein